MNCGGLSFTVFSKYLLYQRLLGDNISVEIQIKKCRNVVLAIVANFRELRKGNRFILQLNEHIVSSELS